MPIFNNLFSTFHYARTPQPTCQRKGQVCGHDGREYSSECAALAEKMSIDYRGPCIRRRPTGDDKTGCSAITCQPLPSENCKGILPPNSCCPICGK
ncbi:UNVERIFIED_CONTAM: Reck [Trichonephila clavipes]